MKVKDNPGSTRPPCPVIPKRRKTPCGSPTRVLRTVPENGGVRRECQCDRGHKFTTIEGVRDAVA